MTDITNMPSAATVGVPLTLTGTISPVNATYQDIIWSITNPGMTGASISGDTFNTTAAGKAVVTATIEQEFSDLKMVAAGDYHTVAIKEDGTLWAWGNNQFGQLGDGSTIDKSTPVQIGTDDNWSCVTAGEKYTVAIKDDGTLWAWGNNGWGQLGDGTTTHRNTPTQEVTVSTNWSYVAAGETHTVAIKDDGTLWAWGNNQFGPLGDGTTTQRNTPTQEETESTNWSYVAAGAYHTVAIKDDGTLWAWGYNQFGPLGDGTTTQRNTPTQEETESTNWSHVAAGYYHTVAIKDDGTLWAWGDNSNGQLGDGTTTQRNTPTQEVTENTNWSHVAAGYYHTAAIKDDGTLWAWGWNSNGQLGDGTTTQSNTPTQEVTENTNWSYVAAGSYYTAAIKDDGTLWAWGYNQYGLLGDGSKTQSNTPTQEVTENTNWSYVAAGYYHTVAIKDDGTLWAWGYNQFGQLGDGTTVRRNTPTQEATESNNWSYVAAGAYHTVAIKDDGTLWAWGNNISGRLGDGTTTHRNTPTQEATGSNNWSYVAVGETHTVAIKDDGTLWAWGNNQFGQLGDGTTTQRDTPTQEATESNNWSYVAAGAYHTVAIKDDGTLWAWGYNQFGQLGDGTTTQRDTPTQEVTESTNWSYVAAGQSHTVAIKDDGTLWAWGTNGYGQLGDGSDIIVNTPKQVDRLNFTKDFIITVTAASAPTITSADNTSVVNGTGGSFTVTSTGYPAVTYSLTGEPEGVSIDPSTGLITIPGSVTAGVYEFTVTASNGVSPDATQEFTLTVTPAPEAPAITSADNTTVVHGTGGSFTVTSTGYPARTYSLSGHPGGVSIDSTTGVITIPGSVTVDVYEFTVTASNGVSPDATQTFRLSVMPAPEAPVITSADNTSVVNGVGGTFTVTSTGYPAATYSLTDEPEGVSIDSYTGVITMSGSLAAGSYEFTVTASNGVSPNATQEFTLTVTPAPEAPTIISADNTGTVYGTESTFAVTATGTSPISYTLSGEPWGVSINTFNGVITISGSLAAGSYEFTVTASNGVSPNATQTFTLTVTPAPEAPTITSADNTSVVNGVGGTFTVTSTGYPAATYSLTDEPAGVSIVPSTGVITISGSLAAGSYEFTVTASNGVSPNATQEFTLTVTPAPEAPTITSADSTSVVNGTGGTFSVTATGDATITYSLTGEPDGVSIDPSTGVMTIEGSLAVNSYEFTVTASNGVSPNATQEFTLTVTPALEAPTITSADSTSVVNGIGGSFTVTSTGYPAATYSLVSAPSGVSVDPSTGVMTIASSVAIGTYTFAVNASNGSLPDAVQTFTLTVTPTPEAPVITSVNNATVVNGTGGSFTVTSTGYPAATYSLIDEPEGVSIDSSTGVITISGSLAAGSYEFPVIVSNEVADAVQTFTLTVTPAPEAPTITSADNTSVVNGTGGTFSVTATGDATITYSLTGEPDGVSIDPSTGVMTIEGSLAVNSYEFTVTASNGVSPNAMQEFTLTVTPAPEAPTIISSNIAGAVNGTESFFTVIATGYPAATYSLAGAPSGVSIDPSTGVMTIEGSVAVNSYEFTVTASNGISPDATQELTLVVLPAPQAPAITSVDNTSVVYGTGGSFTVISTGYPARTYSLTDEPDGVSIDPATGVITILGSLAIDSYEFTVTASNGISPDATQTFTLTVTATPVDLTITSPDNTSVVYGTGGSFTVTSTGSPAATYSLFGHPIGVSINLSSGVITIAPSTAAGEYEFTVTASNGVSPDATQEFTLTVTKAPEITSADNMSVVNGTGGSFTVTSTGYPAATYSLAGVPAGVSIGAFTGVMTIEGSLDAGSYEFTVFASNGVSPDATQEFTLTVTKAPEITSANIVSVVNGIGGSFTVIATGYPAATYSLTDEPLGVSIDSSTGVIMISGSLAAGSYEFTVTASNGVSPNATQTFTLTVTPAPVAPTITSLNNTSVVSGIGGTFNVTATGDATITYSLTGAPAGVSINSSTGAMTIAPSVVVSTHTFTVTASNGVSPNATQEFTLTVVMATDDEIGGDEGGSNTVIIIVAAVAVLGIVGGAAYFLLLRKP